MIVVRFADDIIAGFQHESDARQFLSELADCLRKFTLELHPEKTRLIEFGRFAAKKRKRRGQGKPETFSFLGFTHICGEVRNGRFSVLRQTIRSRMLLAGPKKGAHSAHPPHDPSSRRRSFRAREAIRKGFCRKSANSSAAT